MKEKILIVDDTRTIRFQLRQLLLKNGYEIDEAVDGQDALEKIRLKRPDIVLMDIMMPNMDGIECCRTIKSTPGYSTIKVIMVTTKGEFDKFQAAFRAHCDDFVTKPVAEHELLEKIDDLTKMLRARATLRGL